VRIVIITLSILGLGMVVLWPLFFRWYYLLLITIPMCAAIIYYILYNIKKMIYGIY